MRQDARAIRLIYRRNSRSATDNQRALFGQTGIRSGWRSDCGSEVYHEREIRAVYYPEVERLVEEALGAIKVYRWSSDATDIYRGQGECGSVDRYGAGLMF